jgi:hypothetical protein
MVFKEEAVEGREGRDSGGQGVLVTSMPFVMAETATGVVSFLTGQL